MENNATPSKRAKDVIKRHYPDKVVRYERNGSHFQFFCENDIILRLHILTDSIIRFRYALEGEFEKDFSYAIDKRFKPTHPSLFFDDEGDKYLITTDKIKCEILKEGLLINIYDSFGNTVCEDETGFYLRESIMKGISRLKVTKKAPKTKQYFGLGDKPGKFNLRGRAVENWNTDSFGYDRTTDPLYRSIPFYYALNEGRAYGIFLDNSYRTRFSFDRQDNGVSSFEARGGEMNYYFIYGPELLDVNRQYMQLTGTPEMPPIWALGYHQSRWSYHPEAMVRETAAKFREYKIPCDAIYLDIDYMDGYRCFTWNKEEFPTPRQLTDDLKKEGFKTIVMIDPGIRVDREYWVYQSGITNGAFCKREDGRLMKGPVWPEECVFPDFTNPDVRKWWGGLYKGLMIDDGVDGVWNDMNEPAVFEVESKTFPETVRHNYDGNNCSHRKAHNVYGMQMSRATLEGLKKLNQEKRPFVLTRASYSGGQRFASAWTGDNTSSWEHLHIANVQCQRMSISGFSFIGSDVGGFAQHATAEMSVRWLQLGIFHPLYRMHTIGFNLDGGAKIDEAAVEEMRKSGIVPDQEPYAYGEPFLSHARKAIELRYQLLPYLYTAFWHYVKTGEPIIKPLVFINQEDENTYNLEEEFVFGNQIFVSPIVQPEVTEKTTYLPKGEWYNFNTKEKVEGGQNITIQAQIDQIPIFIKAGAAIPLYPVMQYTNERKISELTLELFYKKGQATSYLYEDKGDGYDYKNGQFSYKTFLLQANEKGFILTQTKNGQYQPTYKTVKLVLNGFPFDKNVATVDGQVITIENGSLIVPADFKKVMVH